MARLGHILITFTILGILCAFIGALWLKEEVKTPGPLTVEKLVYIAPGSSIKAISVKLLANGAIKNNLAFLLSARLQNREKELKAGEYKFLPRMSIREIIALLQSGKTYQHKITIPEGLTTTEIINLLNSAHILTGTIQNLPAEGSLLPETYHFSYGDTRQDIIWRMKKSMKKTLNSLWEKRAANLPLKTPEEAVILASIVEKETGIANERQRVAGVFINRLNKGILLQSDPTVIYAVTDGKEKLNRLLTTKDLKTPSNYNTYIVTGLPPSPIANPGKASLAAVLNPEKNNYIYFVADGTGGHVFSRTLKEHNNNVARWRKLRKKAK
ncbi:MAG: endolytic transglycosylase MltG [Alphaproteobacteria bacterium]|nr:endolytic transglycosylase MltG [Alphaproteobacteria bacterium]